MARKCSFDQSKLHRYYPQHQDDRMPTFACIDTEGTRNIPCRGVGHAISMAKRLNAECGRYRYGAAYSDTTSFRWL